jgi:hypothetical protein
MDMVTTVMILLILCVLAPVIVFIFIIFVDSQKRNLKKHEFDNENDVVLIRK